MKRKNAFTLIELLAVIVVLAIIALIATPIVMNTIKKSQKGAAERSAESYVKQVEVAVAEERLSKNEVLEGEYQITSDGNLCRDKSASCSDDEKIKIEMSGTKPTSGKIKITNGSVDQTSSSMTIGDYDVTYNSTKKTYEATEKGNSTTPDTPQVEVLCTAKTTATTGNVPSGNYSYGDEYTCELGDNDAKTFFVLETNGDNVSLIMDRNIDSNGKGTTSGNTVAWCKSGSDNSCAADRALEYLKNSTTSWTKLTESQISLPTGQQIATAGGDSTWTDSNYTGTTLSTWLYGNLNVNNRAPYGYWTSTSHASNSSYVWDVYYVGVLFNLYHVSSSTFAPKLDKDASYGIRPVITILKSQLN